tara:strand:+ start:7230 stop:7733 length:504 start_codon:yes stop_codon:yes gene_type:complete
MNYNKNKDINIDKFGPNKTAVFFLSDKVPLEHVVSFRDALTNEKCNTTNTLYDLFFSEKNIQTLQQHITQGVSQLSNNKYNVNNQSISELKIIMNSIYVEHSRNIYDNKDNIIVKLNTLVLQYSIPQIITEIESNIKYRRDINNLAVPMSHPILLSKSKQLQQKMWF